MKLYNCPLSDIGLRLGGRKIVFFGRGSWLKQIEHSELEALRDQFGYIIDNASCNEEIILSGKKLQVYSPDRLREENDCVVILTSPVYQYEMFCQLRNMELNSSVSCYSFPFMQLVTHNDIDMNIYPKVISADGTCIPKTIHSFWFSGEPKTGLYKQCVESWDRVMPEYEIIEWNMENYDWHKHRFIERAIELQAWAFASDYARLDVINTYGGIYLDMDIEVFKPFDSLLGNNTILSFTNHVLIDMAMIGSKKDNRLIQRMLETYDSLSLPETKQDFSKYHQPSLLRNTLADYGIKMNGSLQYFDDGTVVFPKDFFMPLDHILFRDYTKSEYTYCVHYDNFGWSYSGSSKREKKIYDNRKLWELIED